MEQPQNKPFIILIDGPMGSGKTTTSKLLNERLGGSARLALADIKRFISGYEKDEKYPKISQEVIKVMTREYLKNGVSVIVECICKSKDISTFSDIGKEYDSSCFAYRLTAPRNILVERIQERTKLMMGVLELPEEKVNELSVLFDRNYKFYEDHPCENAVTIDTSSSKVEYIIERIIKDTKVD